MQQFGRSQVDSCSARFWQVESTAPSLERATQCASTRHHPDLLSPSNRLAERGQTGGRPQFGFWEFPVGDTPGKTGSKLRRKLCLVFWCSQARDSRTRRV